MEEELINIEILNSSGHTFETILGVEYIVKPATILVEKVLNGSNGPIFYKQDQINTSVKSWNFLPLTLNHPPKGVSGKALDFYKSKGLGFTNNSRLDNSSLKVDCYFNTSVLKKEYPSLYKRILNNEKIECSTGLNMLLHNEPGIHNGTDYTLVGTDFKPDHLAILPYTPGACSVKDGCGVNNQGNIMDELIKELVTNGCGCFKESDKDFLATLNEGRLKELVEHSKQTKVTLNESNAALELSKNEIAKLKSDLETITNQNKEITSKLESVENKKNISEEEFLANAPESVKKAVQEGKLAAQEKKANAIATILNTVKDTDKVIENKLNTLEQPVLDIILSLSQEKQKVYGPKGEKVIENSKNTSHLTY